MSILVFQCFHYTYVHMQFPSINNTDLKTFGVKDRLCFLKKKQIRGGIKRKEEKRSEVKGRKARVHEEVRGRRKEGENTETATVEKGQQRQRVSAREKIKNRRRGGKICHARAWGTNCNPRCWGSQLDKLSDQKMKNLHWHFMHILNNILYSYGIFYCQLFKPLSVDQFGSD